MIDITRLLSALPPEGFTVLGNLVKSATSAALKDPQASCEALQDAERAFNEGVAIRIMRRKRKTARKK